MLKLICIDYLLILNLLEPTRAVFLLLRTVQNMLLKLEEMSNPITGVITALNFKVFNDQCCCSVLREVFRAHFLSADRAVLVLSESLDYAMVTECVTNQRDNDFGDKLRLRAYIAVGISKDLSAYGTVEMPADLLWQNKVPLELVEL